MATTTRHTSGHGPEDLRPSWSRRFVAAVDERLGIDALRYPVPEHANNLGWSLGGLTLVSFVALMVTGVYLSQFYNPVPEAANESIRELSNVWLGSFARSLHYWAATSIRSGSFGVLVHSGAVLPCGGGFLAPTGHADGWSGFPTVRRYARCMVGLDELGSR